MITSPENVSGIGTRKGGAGIDESPPGYYLPKLISVLNHLHREHRNLTTAMASAHRTIFRFHCRLNRLAALYRPRVVL